MDNRSPTYCQSGQFLPKLFARIVFRHGFFLAKLPESFVRFISENFPIVFRVRTKVSGTVRLVAAAYTPISTKLKSEEEEDRRVDIGENTGARS